MLQLTNVGYNFILLGSVHFLSTKEQHLSEVNMCSYCAPLETGCRISRLQTLNCIFTTGQSSLK